MLAHKWNSAKGGRRQLQPLVRRYSLLLRRQPARPSPPENPAAGRRGSYYLISTMMGLSLSLIRITMVLDILSVALRPKCGVLGGV